MDKQDIQHWNGEGLPPVGTVCEFAGGTYCAEDPFDKDLKVGAEVTIIAHIFDGDFELAAFTFNPRLVNPDRGTISVEQGAYGCFRPIRTPEQIEAERRERVVCQIALEIIKRGSRSTPEAIYDAIRAGKIEGVKIDG
jgi:hypothetical protein